VDNETIFACKVFATELALELTHLGVNGHLMVLEVTPLPKVAVTVITFIGFLPRMKTHVDLEGGGGEETFPAQGTAMGSFPRVGSHVVQQGVPMIEHSATFPTC